MKSQFLVHRSQLRPSELYTDIYFGRVRYSKSTIDILPFEFSSVYLSNVREGSTST